MTGIALLLLFPGRCRATVCPDFDDLIRHGSYGVADRSGQILAGCGLDDQLVPASLVKVPTAMAALAILGPTFRFPTELYLDGSGNLYLKGFGDPLLISEEVERIAAALSAQGLRKVASVFIDDSAYALEGPVPGSENSANPYDAPVAPTAVNFNSVPLVIGTDMTVSSGEEHTPSLPLMQEFARGLLPGRYRINICHDGAAPEQRAARYAGELFAAKLVQAGVRASGRIGRKRVPPGASLLLTHRGSNDMAGICESMLKYSSNFIANQVFLAVGGRRFGYPATWAKAREAVSETLLREVGNNISGAYRLVDGAGLSRGNRMSARTALHILKAFQPHARLLRKRRSVLLKTGTMDGVYNLAGYLADGKPYVVLLNQPANTRSEVLDRLQRLNFPPVRAGEENPAGP